MKGCDMNTHARKWCVCPALSLLVLCGPVSATETRVSAMCAAEAQPAPPPQELMAAVAAGLAQRQRGEPGYGNALRRAAAGLSRAGHTPTALDVLTEVIQQPESDFDLMEGLRMRGQYARARGRATDARLAFTQMLELVDERPVLLRFTVSYVGAVQQYAAILASEGDFAGAAVVHERILQLPGGAIEEFIRAGAFVTSAHYYERAGEIAAAIETIDRLFAEYPQFGAEDGRAVRLLVHRAELDDPTHQTEGYIDALRALWARPELAGSPDLVDVGERLSAALWLRGSVEESLDVATGAVALADNIMAELQALDPGDFRLVELGESRASLVSRLSSADSVGRRDLAAWALGRLIQSATDDEVRADLQRQLSRLQ